MKRAIPKLWRGYHLLPDPSLIGEAAIPENRPEVLKKMIAAMDAAAPKGFCQQYTNGEFISNSTIIGRTFEAAADRSLDLDGASDAVYFDRQLQIYWRRGGCFD